MPDVVVLRSCVGGEVAHAAARRAHPRLDHPPRRCCAVGDGPRGADRARRRSQRRRRRSSPRACVRGRRRAPRRRAPLRRRPGRARARSPPLVRERIAAELRLMRIATVVGNRPQFVKAAGVCGAAARAPRGDPDPHRPAPRRRALGGLLRGARHCRPPITISASPAARNTSQLARMLARARAAAGRARPRRRARLRRHQLDARRRARGRRPRNAGDPRRGGDALVRPHASRRSATAC